MSDAKLEREPVHRALIPIPRSMLPRLDGHADRIRARAKNNRLQVSRTDVILELLERALDDVERAR
jgi:hypothetical protein